MTLQNSATTNNGKHQENGTAKKSTVIKSVTLVEENEDHTPTKKIAQLKRELPTATVVVPPDGGWGWVVMVASFCCNSIVDGIVMNAGSFTTHIEKEFNVSTSRVVLASSLLSGFYLIAGPFASALANKWGFRPVTLIGSFIAAFAFSITYFANSVYFLYIIYGVIGGIGFSFIYIPSVITVGYYFERWRALATGIAMCGSGVGTIIFGPLNQALIKRIGWKSTFLVHGGIILLCALFAITYRPLKPVEITIDADDDDEENEDDKDETIDEKRIPTGYPKAFYEGRYAYSVPNSVHNTWIGASNNTTYPTAAEIFRGSGANLDRRPSGPTGPAGNVLNSSNIHNTTKKLEQLSKSQQHRQNRTTGQSSPNDDVFTPPSFNLNKNLTKNLNTVGEAEEENESDALIDEKTKPVFLTTRRHTVSGRRPNLQSTGSLKGGRSKGGPLHDNRPLYRDDIFFSGSLVRIPQYKSQSSLGYHMSVTRLPTQNDVDEEEKKSCSIFPEAVRRTLATMLDMSLLRSPSFMLLASSGFLTMMGFFVPFMFVKARAVQGNMDESIATFIVSAIGISNTIARVGCGLASSFKGVNALYINNIFITIGGIATILSGLSLSSGYQFTYAAIFGIAIACFSALRSIIAVDLLGLEKLTNAFGILMLFQGLAAVLGTPIAGAFFDITKSYDFSFYFAGGLITVSALLCYPLNYVSAWEKKRAEEKSNAKPIV